MKTLVILGAAALLALPSVASARTKTTVVSFDGYCDVVTIKVTGSLVAGQDSCAGGFGGGMVVKQLGGQGKSIVAGVQFPVYAGYQFVLQLSYPLVTGGTWTMYATTDGTELDPFEAGTYTVQNGPSSAPRGALPAVAALHR
ncbi:MAG TPA: hypothetical protein VGM17_17535 [Rhizomicrobium sp.]